MIGLWSTGAMPSNARDEKDDARTGKCYVAELGKPIVGAVQISWGKMPAGSH